MTVPGFGMKTVDHWQLVVIQIMQNYLLYICLICSTIGTGISTVLPTTLVGWYLGMTRK